MTGPGIGTNGLVLAPELVPPDSFWFHTSTRTRKVVITKNGSVHLMPAIWHTGENLVPPDFSPQVTIKRGGETVTGFAPWLMLSQPMGSHFGTTIDAIDGGADLALTVDAPPQTARHEGYETAFIEMEDLNGTF